MTRVRNTSSATVASSSNVTSTSTSNRLKQPSTTATKASLLKSKDSDQLNVLKSI
jgi:hypothetical protein